MPILILICGRWRRIGKKNQLNFKRLAENIADGGNNDDDNPEVLEKKSDEFKKILEVPKEERDRIQRMQVIDRVAAAIVAAQALLKETPPLNKASSSSSLSSPSSPSSNDLDSSEGLDLLKFESNGATGNLQEEMRKKSRAGRARVSKVPPKPSSVATQALNLGGDNDDVMDHLTVAERLKLTKYNVDETEEQGNEAIHVDAKDDSIVPPKPSSFANGALDLGGHNSDDPTLAERLKVREYNVDETEEQGNEAIHVNAEDDSIVPETQNSCDVDGYNDKNAAPDTNEEVIIPKENPKSMNSPSTLNWDTLEMSDWTEQGICIKCNKGDNEVLVCKGDGCPSVIHLCCLGCPPTFDDAGNFYCPLCSYKRVVSELEEAVKEVVLAKEKVHSARKSLSQFFGGSNKKESTEKIRKRELNHSRMDVDCNCVCTNKQSSDGLPEDQQEARTTTKCSNGNLGKETYLASKRNGILLTSEGDNENQVGSYKRKSMEDQQEAVIAVGNLVVGKSHARKDCDTSASRGKCSKQVNHHHLENIENQQEAVAADDHACERSDASHGRHNAEHVDSHPCENQAELRRQVGPSVTCGSDNVSCGEDLRLPSEFGRPLTRAAKANETEMVEEHQQPKEREQQLKVESNIGIQNRNSPCRETETVSVDSVHAECLTQNPPLRPRVVDPVMKSCSKISIDKRKTASNNKSASCTSNPALPHSRRKRLAWTSEEEEMLREGVKIAGNRNNKPMPWRYILEFGRKVFDVSRTPVDLKDKWRNMTEGSLSARKK